MHYVQTLVGDKWVANGEYNDVAKDGKRSECTYANGEVDGLSRVWHSNGQLIKEVTFVNCKRNGIGRSWNPEGKLEYEATYVNDVEVAGEAY